MLFSQHLVYLLLKCLVEHVVVEDAVVVARWSHSSLFLSVFRTGARM